MRHHDAMMRTTVMSTGNTIQMLQRQNARLQETVENLIEEKFKSITLVEDLLSQKNERDIATMKETNKQTMYREAFDKVSLLAPVVINKLAGRKAVPEAENSMTMLLKRFLESLKPEQTEIFMKTLAPDQQIAMMEIFAQYNTNETERVKQLEGKKQETEEKVIQGNVVSG